MSHGGPPSPRLTREGPGLSRPPEMGIVGSHEWESTGIRLLKIFLGVTTSIYITCVCVYIYIVYRKIEVLTYPCSRFPQFLLSSPNISLNYMLCPYKIPIEQCSTPSVIQFHWWIKNRFLSSRNIIISNTLGSITPELIIGKQWFWTHFSSQHLRHTEVSFC